MATTGNTTINLQHCLDLLRDGDDYAPTEMVSHAYRRLRRMARGMLRGFPSVRRREEAEDVLHPALLRLLRALADDVPESLAHFYNLARLQIRRELLDRKQHYAVRCDCTQQEPPDRVDQNDEPGNLSDWSEFHRLVDALPEDERNVFKQIWYEGRTRAEVAKVLNICETTVTRRWQSARILLQREFHGKDNDDGRR